MWTPHEYTARSGLVLYKTENLAGFFEVLESPFILGYDLAETRKTDSGGMEAEYYIKTGNTKVQILLQQ